MESYGKNELEKVLLKIDEEASLVLGDHAPRCRVVVVGGSAMLLADLTARPTTHDVDVLEADRRLREILSNYNMVNSAVMAYADQIPYNYEDRLVSLELDTKIVDYFVPCPEDLAVMKLYAMRPNDVADLESEAFLAAIDWQRMDELVLGPDEAAGSALVRRRYEEMADAYRSWAKDHGHEANA